MRGARLTIVALAATVLAGACGESLPERSVPLARTASKVSAARPGPAPQPAPTTPTTVQPAPVPPTAPPATPAPAPVPTTTTLPQLAAASLSEPSRPWTAAAYRGFGAWVDVYDWSVTFSRGSQPISVGDIDRMRALGVQTLFIQASKWDSPTDILEPQLLGTLIKEARARRMRVVAWYLPRLEDPATDLRRLLAIAKLPVDGLAVDIEATQVHDIAERNRRVIALSQTLRKALPGRAIGAIPFDPVLLDVINPRLWPAFPWKELDQLYDVWLPMSYWTMRKHSSGYREGYRYTAENIDRLRAHVGRQDAAVHTIGGIGHQSSVQDIDGMVRAATERGTIGGSLYDYRTTHEALWPLLQRFRV